MTSIHGSWNLEFYGPTNFNQTVSTQLSLGLFWNFMRWLILGQTYFLSKLEYDSTTHIDKRTTFWCSTFDMKNKKISKSCDHIISVIYRWNRLNEPKNMNYTENEISKMSNFGKLIFISPLSLKNYLSPMSLCMWSVV